MVVSSPRPSKLSLHDVTLVCVDTRTPRQALEAVQKCISQVDFGRVIFFGNEGADSCAMPLDGIDWIGIPALRNIGEYSRFVLHGLLPHIQTSHCLIVQWDGFVVDASMWRDDFLSVDYIGPPWYHKSQAIGVGNGGFSLRSRRLLEALAQLPCDGDDAEDDVICKHLRQQLIERFGIEFAPADMAAQFGIEQGPLRPTFGFHGIEHFARMFSETELEAWLNAAPDELILHKHTRKLVKSLIAEGRRRQAWRLNARRAQKQGWRMDHVKLAIRACLLGG
ncbi:MAG: hypothetical protein I8H76_02910 [Burkholderiales bacterium]|nr:hypothetical protein [Burkholderiales bacterium]MBH2015117.1 hypothetical protein [Burkholderiales bacterium]